MIQMKMANVMREPQMVNLIIAQIHIIQTKQIQIWTTMMLKVMLMVMPVIVMMMMMG
jgi:hypothetical protein